MTMPHLENCRHIETGWCLSCVKKMHDELESERDDARNAARWWMRRDQEGHDPSVITDQIELWPWLSNGDK